MDIIHTLGAIPDLVFMLASIVTERQISLTTAAYVMKGK